MKSILVLALFLLTGIPALADGEDPDDYKEERLPFGYVRSMDAYNSGGHPTASSLLLAAEMENRYGHHDKAIHICQKALTIDPEDMDVHKAYAECLEGKLRKQKGDEKDLNLFLAAVREWLIVLRGERGEERGLTNKNGVGIPGMTHLYRDEDRAMPAKQHIIALVGRSPKGRESDQKFMMDVARRAQEMVHIRMLKQKGSVGGDQQIIDEEVGAKIISSEEAKDLPQQKKNKKLPPQSAAKSFPSSHRVQ